MRLIHQKQILLLRCLLEKAFQIHIRIKYIIIIAQNIVAPRRNIQTQFERTYPMLLRLRNDLLPRKEVRFLQKLIHRIIHTVIMPQSIRTILWVTLQLLLWEFRVWILLNLIPRFILFSTYPFITLLCEIKQRNLFIFFCKLCLSSTQAQFLLRRQLNDLRLIALLPQQSECLFRDGCRNRLCRQIENAIC